MKLWNIIVCGLLICLTSAVSVGQQADRGTVLLEGSGIVKPDSDPLPKDKEAALAAALRKMILDSLAKNPQTGSSQRLGKAAVEKMALGSLSEFFAGQEIVQEKTRTGYYEVRVAATLDTAKLEKWASLLKDDQSIKKLRVAVVIPEQHLSGPIPDPAGETEVIRQLIKEGFRVVDAKQVQAIRDNDLVIRARKGDPKELLAIARSWDAGLLVVGQAFSQDVLRDPAMMGNSFPCRGHIEAKIFFTDTADILWTGDADGGAMDLSPAVAAKAAIRAAATKMADTMITSLLVDKTGTQARGSIRVVVAGVDFEQKLLFKQVLGDMKELVTEAEEISYLESRVEMDVVTSTTSEKLAEAVFLGAKKQGMKLKVLESTNRRCVFEVPAAAAPKEETR